MRIKFAKCVLFFFYFHFVLLLFLIFIRLSPIYPCSLHRHLYKLCQSSKSLEKLKSTNNLLFISLLASIFLLLRFVVPSFIVRLSVWLAPSFVFLKLALTSPYLRISLVFQTDSLYLFLFKACPPSGVRGLLIRLFPICSCNSHCHLYKLCQSFKSLEKLKSTNNLLFISALASTFLLLRFVVPSFIVCLLFVVEPL